MKIKNEDVAPYKPLLKDLFEAPSPFKWKTTEYTQNRQNSQKLEEKQNVGPNMLRILPRVGEGVWTTLLLPKIGSTWIDLKNYFYSLIQKAL